MSQISLPFEWPGQGTDGDFLVSDANAVAVRHLEAEFAEFGAEHALDAVATDGVRIDFA